MIYAFLKMLKRKPQREQQRQLDRIGRPPEEGANDPPEGEEAEERDDSRIRLL